jgi:hypothetical protein
VSCIPHSSLCRMTWPFKRSQRDRRRQTRWSGRSGRRGHLKHRPATREPSRGRVDLLSSRHRGVALDVRVGLRYRPPPCMPVVTGHDVAAPHTYRIDESRPCSPRRWECGDCGKSSVVHPTPDAQVGCQELRAYDWLGERVGRPMHSLRSRRFNHRAGETAPPSPVYHDRTTISG